MLTFGRCDQLGNSQIEVGVCFVGGTNSDRQIEVGVYMSDKLGGGGGCSIILGGGSHTRRGPFL